MEVETVTAVAELLEMAGPLLLADEPRHNLAFGILSVVRDHPDVYPELQGWVVRDGMRVVAVALRTPPMNLVLARPLDVRAVDALVAAIDDDLPGVVGAVPEVDAFSTAWSAKRPVTVTTRFEQRIYAVRAVEAPRGVEGALRLAGPGDRELALAWMRAFSDEVLHEGEGDADRFERSVDTRLLGLATRGIALWEREGEPVSLAGYSGPTPNGIRIGPRLHPAGAPRPRLRQRGHGTGVAAPARSRATALLPLHGSREPYVERHLPAHRLRAGLRLARDLLLGRRRLTARTANPALAARDVVAVWSPYRCLRVKWAHPPTQEAQSVL